jgi:hypothetical protein
MNVITRDLIRMFLARTVFVATAFGVTLVAYVLAGQAPDRSFADWIALASVLSLLALAGGLLTASVELQQR